MPSEVLKHIQELGREALEEIEVLEAKKQEINGEIRLLRTFARQSGITRTPAKPTKSGRRKHISDRKLLTIAEACLRFDEDFSTQDIVQAIGGSDSQLPSTRLAISKLREMQFLAAVGQRSTGHGRAREYFRVLDRDVIKTLRRHVAAA